ncbi:MAG: hypothetical protein ACPGVT_08095 [Maricaulaceae bacterium]
MPIHCLNAFTSCSDPAREDEFNRWYSHTHLPDLAAAKGFLRARRFVNKGAGAGQARYWAQYEFETDDPAASVASFLGCALTAYETGRHIDCIESHPPAGGAMWELIEPNALTPLDEAKMDYPKTPPKEIGDAIAAMQARFDGS